MYICFFLDDNNMFNINFNGRAKITYSTNEYNNDDTDIKCIPGMYDIKSFYNEDRSISRIIISHPDYVYTDDIHKKMLHSSYCNLTNSKQFIIIGSDNYLFNNEGINMEIDSYTNIVFSPNFIAVNMLTNSVQTEVSIYTNDSSDIFYIDANFKYTSYF